MVRLKQIYGDVNMAAYRGVDSFRRLLEEKKANWKDGDVFMFRNRTRNIMVAFAPNGNAYAYKKLPKKESFDFSVRSRDEILTLFGKALGMRWNEEDQAARKNKENA